MTELSRVAAGWTIGMDLGDKYSRLCVLDEHGDVCEETRIPTTRRAIEKRFTEANPCRVAAPLTKVDWVLRLPPIIRGRRRIAVCPGGAVFSFVVSAYRIGAVPGTIGNHGDLRCVS